jgi:hypothetical protein
MTSTEHDVQAVASRSRLDTLRGNCMGAAVLLIVQFGLGTGINLYGTLPRNKSFFSTVFGSAALAAHVVVALLLLGACVSALVRAIRARRAIVPTSVGLAAVVAAGFSGASFASNSSNGASLGMALATAIAMFSFLVAIISLR